MNAIDELFARLRKERRTAFMPFLTAGDPDLKFTLRLMRAASDAGADLIELGFPFSDPIADGPVIQASYTRALDKGVRVGDILDAVGEITRNDRWETPAVGMVSFSLVYRLGPERFLDRAKAAGFSGAIVPDLPAEEADGLAAMARDRDFKLILLVTPTTSERRAERIVGLCSGFVYCVSVVGITGERTDLPPALEQQLGRLRGMTDLPLCVGFGVSRPEQAGALREVADGVIVGSAIVRRVQTIATGGAEPDSVIAEVKKMVSDFAGALR